MHAGANLWNAFEAEASRQLGLDAGRRLRVVAERDVSFLGPTHAAVVHPRDRMDLYRLLASEAGRPLLDYGAQVVRLKQGHPYERARLASWTDLTGTEKSWARHSAQQALGLEGTGAHIESRLTREIVFMLATAYQTVTGRRPGYTSRAEDGGRGPRLIELGLRAAWAPTALTVHTPSLVRWIKTWRKRPRLA